LSETRSKTAGKRVRPKRRSAADRALAAALLAVLRAGGDVRQRKVRRVRAAIRAQRYENALKLAVAAERATSEG
jgi:hypothetical protein